MRSFGNLDVLVVVGTALPRVVDLTDVVQTIFEPVELPSDKEIAARAVEYRRAEAQREEESMTIRRAFDRSEVVTEETDLVQDTGGESKSLRLITESIGQHHGHYIFFCAP